MSQENSNPPSSTSEAPSASGTSNKNSGLTDRTLACFCNNVSITTVNEAIQKNNAKSLTEIYDLTGAGVGPCGGSCRSFLKTLLAHHVPSPSPELADVTIPTELYQAASLFNRRYYWETHEVLEGLWLRSIGKEKIFYQGLIQAAAALYHVLNSNPQGVIKLADSAQEKLRPFLPEFQTVKIENIVLKLGFFSNQAREILGSTLSGFDYKQLPQMVIGEEMDSKCSPGSAEKS